VKFTRNNKSFLSSWWWTVDRVILSSIIIILALSALMVATASPAVADRIGLESSYFIKRQIFFIFISFFLILIFSFLNIKQIKIISFIGFIACVFLMIVVLFYGSEIKGARRWVSIAGLSIQPSEFIKPFFAVIIGYILSLRYYIKDFPVYKVALATYAIIVILLFLQPDFGMIITLSCILAGQFFLAGISMGWIIALTLGGVFGVVIAYMLLPHVAVRINNFIDPSVSENYQVNKSIAAFVNGGFFGKGPGEGVVKQSLPDSHTDFIFAVIGEELGIITCLFVIVIYAIIVLRGMFRISNQIELFSAYSVAGLLMIFGVQSVVNIGVSLHLLPTKGMTLPFLSYGGSSMMAVSISIGMILSLTKKKYGHRFKYRRRGAL
jgi:cell division protein FtsW